MTAPAKRWRVTPDSASHSLDLRSQNAAYEQVRIYADRGEGVTVHRWENGSWRLYERIEPTPGASHDH